MSPSNNVPVPAQQHDEEVFAGFQHPTANFIYCPNQFFDVCLPHSPQVVVRLVAYILDKTLGWLDEDGNPIEQDISVSYRELITKAGISRGAVRAALDDAVAAGFVICTTAGRPNEEGQAAQTAQYRLRWDASPQYTTDVKTFGGFYTGEGHRTAVPNAFFRHVVRRESLAVVKVVAAVLRHTLGYANQFGGRRMKASLSYSYIQNYTRIGSRTTLSKVLHQATERGYIHRIAAGCFHANKSKRLAATYAVRWRSAAASPKSSSESGPEQSGRFKKQTSESSESGPEERFKKWTKEKTQKKNTLKQQAPAVAAEDSEALRILTDIGFDEETASKLSESRGLDEIKQQIVWLDERNPRDNKLGMLRKAIEQDWAKPATVEQAEKKRRQAKEARAEAKREELEDAEIAKCKQERIRQRNAALVIFNSMSAEERTALEKSTFDSLDSGFFRKRFRTNEEFRLQQCLDEICRREGISAPSLAA